MSMGYKPPIVPAAFFGIVLGLAGLGSAWRAAHQVWHLPAIVGEIILALASVVWAVLIALFALRWIFARAESLHEAHHPVQCCFIGLAGVSTMLIALAAEPYSRLVALSLFGLGSAFTLGFALWRTGLLWRGNRDHTATTPVLYLPTVAGGFVTAGVSAALGYPDWGQLAFGVALFSWFAIESVLLHRLYIVETLPIALRPTLGIQLAPPVVGAVSYLAINGGVPDMFAHVLVGYGLMMALLLLRLLPWIMEQPFSVSYWSFTFGATALAIAPIRMVGHGDTGAIALLAPYLFAVANVVVGLIALGTLRLIIQGRLLPPPVAAPSPPQAAPA
ncbi:dicarboxylate transporter/tellurite-resistance protein TehA [Bradyrhizobium manausense]|uniref:dicarboxylate transporter/tellurite-resistance protein TehA n=1 Tax=Bradyrhizobium manausense TaxID=989370 RepID=UPI001BA49E05|nr:dicarboxylate transporter/tellurite-resistance protein TehA [Bradyrhizobium manausense]MBR1089141.1 dicarboxylate transporter/tellurite-resistance protein TehA [Bradyrhizobium manausense]